MKKLLFTSLLILVGFVFTSNAQTTITSAQTGDWNLTTTWVGSVVPTVLDAVIISSGHNVTKTAVGDTCSTLTLNAGATFTLGTGSSSSEFRMPTASWSCNVTSTVVLNGPTTVQTANPYGNLIYNSANGSPDGDLTVNGNLTIAANTLRGISAATGSRTHSITGDVLLTGTSSKISAVNYTGASTSSCVWNIGGSVKLNGLGSGCRLIIWESAGEHAGSATYNIGGNLELNGTGSQVQFKTSSGTGDNYSEGIINLSGNLVQNGPIGINSIVGGVSPGLTINFVGTSLQTWSGTGAFSASNSMGWLINVNINNASGVTLTAPRAINDDVALNLINGKLTTDATNLLTINAFGGAAPAVQGSITGGSSSSFVNGPLQYANATAGAFSKTYPIGKGIIYRPIILSLNQTAATSSSFKAEMFNAAPVANGYPGTLNAVSLVRHYIITEGGSVPSAFTAGAVTLSYNTDDGVTDEINLRVAQGPVGGGTWTDLGGTGSASPTGTILSTVAFIALTTDTVFTLANNSGGTNPLPVELTSFTAAAKDGVVELAWTTATETNNYGWDIEMRKNSETSWERIGFISGAGNSNSAKKYSFVDKSANQSGSYSYRLKQIDADGKFSYSNEVMVKVETPITYSLGQNYPNPFNPSTSIAYTLPADSKVTLAIYSLIGEKVADLVNEEQTSGYYSYQFSSRALNLTSGVYLYKLTAISKTNEVFSQSRKMLLLK